MLSKMAKAGGNDLGKSDSVSRSFTKSVKSQFAKEMSTAASAPIETARAAQSTEQVCLTYLGKLNALVDKWAASDKARPTQTWPDGDQWTCMDEQGYSHTPRAVSVFGEKQRAAQKRLKQEMQLEVVPRDLVVRKSDRSTHDATVCHFIKPDATKYLPYPPLVIHPGKLMNALKLMYKERPDGPLLKLADLKEKKGDDWCVYTNEWGGMDQNAFELTVNYIIEKEAEHGIGKDGKTGFLQVDHHGSRDSADAQRKLYDNNWNVAGPVSHGSHWGAALDCGYNAFADREMCKRLSAWYAAAKPGQQINPADFNGLLVDFYYSCKEGDLRAECRQVVMKCCADVGILDGKRSSMKAFDKVKAVGVQFGGDLSNHLSLGERGRRTSASNRASGMLKTEERPSDGQTMAVYTANKEPVGAIQSAVFNAMFEKEIKPAQEHSRQMKTEKEASKQRMKMDAEIDDDDSSGSSSDEETVEQRAALDSRRGYFYSTDMQHYLDNKERLDSKAKAMKGWKAVLQPMLKEAKQTTAATFAAAKQTLKEMKEKIEEAEPADMVVRTKKKLAMLRAGRTAILKTDSSITPLEAVARSAQSVRKEIAVLREQAASKLAAKEAKGKATAKAPEKSKAKAGAGAARKVRALSTIPLVSTRVNLSHAAEPKRDASSSPPTKPVPKRGRRSGAAAASQPATQKRGGKRGGGGAAALGSEEPR